MNENQEPKRYQEVGTKVDGVLSTVAFVLLVIGFIAWLLHKA